MIFKDIKTDDFAGATVFLDVDGTLVPDKNSQMLPETEKILRDLTGVSKVWLCSNGSPQHARAFAERTGAQSFECFKPFPDKIARSLARSASIPIVIGDKVLTDGLFAAFLGARFIKIQHLRSAHDSITTKLTYSLDDMIWGALPYVLIMRPWHWIKNILVFTPLFFVGGIFVWKSFTFSTIAFLAFCAAASFVYIFNDFFDRAQDALHPNKRHRPLAAGQISWVGLVILASSLLAATTALIVLIPALFWPISVYLGLNAAYSLLLKRIPVLDVLCVAAFYILRITAGSVATGIPLSWWILICTFFGALFVITGKRYAELQHASQRHVLSSYPRRLLKIMLVFSLVCAIMAYAIYSVVGHSSTILVYSTIFVAFALIRYLKLIYKGTAEAESPEILVFKDPWILGSFLGWVVYVFILFYTQQL